MGDWNEQKLIVAKKINDDNQPIAYKDPFDSFVNITNNLVGSSLKSQGLIANDANKKQVLLWSYNKETSDALIKNTGDIFNGYTRLAINASFQTWLKELDIVTGDYGLILKLEVEPEDSDDIKSDGNSVESNIKICHLNCSDMIGNPYNYQSFYTQKKLFDISTLKNIQSMELWFYQKEGSFKNREGNAVASEKTPNIFVKDIAISLGYDTNSFENDTLVIYTMDSIKYDVKKTPAEDNHKKLYARWIHKFENDRIKVVELEDGIDYTLTWYRYTQGARSHTAWSGVDWIPLATQKITTGQVTYTINDGDWTTYNTQSLDGVDTPIRNISYNQAWLLPDTTRAEEKIKAIIEFNDGEIIYSPQLLFSNVDEVVNKATVDAIQALSINCEDESFGNYLIYNLGGEILDSADAQEIREFKAYFNSAADDIDDNSLAELIEAEEIEWIIPANNSMILVDEFISRVEDLEPIDGYYHIHRFGDQDGNIRNQNSQRYRIRSFYSQNYSNNTIKCIITKNKIKYTAIKELTFGPAGTSGTDYTFVLDFDGGVSALTLKSDYKDEEIVPAVTVTARLFDYKGQPIPDLKNKDITWYLDTDENGNLIRENDFITLVPVKEENADGTESDIKNKIEVQLKQIEDENNPGSMVEAVKDIPLNNYTILKAILKSARQSVDNAAQGWGDYDLYAYLPIPIRSSRKYQFISGTDTIVYNSLGYLDDYFQNPYCLHYMNDEEESQIINGTWKIYSGEDREADSEQNIPAIPDIYKPQLQKNSSEQYYIQPINMYVENSMKELCVVGSVQGEKIWSQPLFVTQNKYPSSIINEWNGKLTIDNANNAILAAKIAAGKKNDDDNTFSGVMMGDWSGNDTSSAEGAITENTGIYGFQHGIASFGFRDDGTAFIGKPGAGRLEFDGTKSIIQSNKMALGIGGLKLDFDDGSIELKNPITEFQVILKQDQWDLNKSQQFSLEGILKNCDLTLKLSQNATEDQITAWNNANCSAIVNEDNKVTIKYTGEKPGLDLFIEIASTIIKGSILLDAAAIQTPLTVGTNFKVNWDGSIWAKDGDFIGHIEASSGEIGAWKIESIGGNAGALHAGDINGQGGTWLYPSGQISAASIITNDGKIGGWFISESGLSSQTWTWNETTKAWESEGTVLTGGNIFITGKLTASQGTFTSTEGGINLDGYLTVTGAGKLGKMLSSIGGDKLSGDGIGMSATGGGVVKATTKNAGMSYSGSYVSCETGSVNIGETLVVNHTLKVVKSDDANVVALEVDGDSGIKTLKVAENATITGVYATLA